MAIEIVDFPSYKMVIFHSYVKLPGGKVRCKHVDLFEAPNVSHAHMSYSLLHQPLPLDLHSHSLLDVSSSMIMTYLDKFHHNLTATSLEQWLMRTVIRNGLNVYR